LFDFAALLPYTPGMSESGKNEAIFKKSYEISYALWRIAANVREQSFADTLRSKAGALIGFSADGDLAAIGKLLPTMELLIKFGVDVGAVGIGNGEKIFYEIGNLKAAIKETTIAEGEIGKKSGKENEVYLDDIFTGSVAEKNIAVDLETETGPEIEPIKLETFLEDNGVSAQREYDPATSQKAEMRQAAILERIRQIGNCRLADIQIILPETSERTIRYDLEALVQKGLVERLGTGGRSVYYRVVGQAAGQASNQPPVGNPQ
jgi:hypothetical protein